MIIEFTHFRFANDKLLPNDCLNILCVMKFRGSEVTTSGTSKPTSCSLHKSPASEGPDTEEAESGESRGSRGLLELLQTGDLADVDVVVGEKTFRCHKAILGARSPFFKVIKSRLIKLRITNSQIN